MVFTFSREKTSCRAAMDIVSYETGTSTPSVRIPTRLGSLVRQRKLYFKLETCPLYHKNLLDLDLAISL